VRAFLRLLAADFKQFLRDRVALFFTFAFPVLFMLLFGFIFSGNEDISYNIGMVNEDSSPVSQSIVRALEDVVPFSITQGTLDEELSALRSGERRAVVLIPANLGSALNSGQDADIVTYYDPSQATSSQIILSIMREVVGGINQQITQRSDPLSLREESIQSQELSYISYLVPGVLSMSILFLGLFSGIVQVERREKKALKRFGATPLKKQIVILSQITQRLIIALLQTLIIIAVAHFAFNVEMVGNWFAVFGLVFLGTLTFISFGYFIVARARTAESAQPIIQFVQFPMMFLSGIFFPVEFMPAFMKPIMAAMPLTYLGDGLRQIMVAATPTYPMALNLGVLGAWLVVCMLLSFWLFKWE